LTLKGNGHPGLPVSPEHPFYARQRKFKWDNARRQERPFLTAPQWAPASCLENGKNRYTTKNGRQGLLENGWHWASPQSIPALPVPPIGGRGMAITEQLLWLAGRYLGDGWTRLTKTRAELIIICGKHETKRLRPLLDQWPRTGLRSKNNELTWSERDLETAHQFSTTHRGLVTWLRKNFGHGAANKSLPAWVYGLPNPMKEALLAGYFSADGSLQRTECRISTISKKLAFSIKTLLTTLGISPGVLTTKNGSTIQGRVINAKLSWIVNWRTTPKRQTHISEDNINWTPIKNRSDVSTDLHDVFNIGVEDDESYVVEGIIVHNCRMHSRARGGPVTSKRSRDLAWVVVKWAIEVKPRVIALENVEEFRDWCDLDPDGSTRKAKKGATFKKFVASLANLGYKVEHRLLRACDFGAPTIRKRLFLIARRDGAPIVWAEPTHADPSDPRVIAGQLKPWRTAAECIDWSIPCPSIFLSREEARKVGANRPLAPATMARTAKGVFRYVINAADPFLIPITHHGTDDRSRSLDKPLTTITCANRGETALVAPTLRPFDDLNSSSDLESLGAPFVTKFRTGSTGSRLADPLPTVTANSHAKRPGGATPLGLIMPTLEEQPDNAIEAAFIQPQYGASVARSLDEPLQTITAGGAGKAALVAAFLGQQNGGMVGHDVREPLSTVVGKGSTQTVAAVHLQNLYGSNNKAGRGKVTQPLGAITANGQHTALVAAFLTKYYKTEQNPNLRQPMATVTTKERFALSTVVIDGKTFVITDIGMRMLHSKELYIAQGFSKNYIFHQGLDENGKIVNLTKTAQIRMCGNSVSPACAEAIISALFPNSAVSLAVAA
jgi:DNA (cytosine-5)-methyltransferase 1